MTTKTAISFAAMRKRHDSEWVLVADPVTTDDLIVKSGKVLWHSKDRDEVYRKARELAPKHSAILYFGRIPKEVAVIL